MSWGLALILMVPSLLVGFVIGVLVLAWLVRRGTVDVIRNRMW